MQGGCGCDPLPAQAGQAPIWIDFEAEELHTVRSTSPRPWQTSQVTGTTPSARPPPLGGIFRRKYIRGCIQFRIVVPSTHTLLEGKSLEG